MFSVRFPADWVRAVRRFASQDGVTVSEWIRKLVDAELKNPQRSRAVDVSEYGPPPQTVSSGMECQIEWRHGGPASGNVTA